MNAYIKSRWIQALRNGKRKQITKYLHTEDGFDVLGVLVDLYLRDKKKEWDRKVVEGKAEPFFRIGDNFAAIPVEVRKWAQLSAEQAARLAQMNDMQRKTFSEIADYIEAYL